MPVAELRGCADAGQEIRGNRGLLAAAAGGALQAGTAGGHGGQPIREALQIDAQLQSCPQEAIPHEREDHGPVQPPRLRRLAAARQQASAVPQAPAARLLAPRRPSFFRRRTPPRPPCCLP